MAGLEDIPSYIFGGTSGTPSYEELLRRRQVAVANAMRGRKAPTTLGEGMTYLGEAIGDRIEGGRLSEAERLLAAKEAADRKAAPGGGYVPGSGAATPPVTGAVPFSGVGAGNLSGAGVRDRIAALVQDQEDGVAPQEVAQANPTWAVAELPPTTPTPGGPSGDIVERRRNAVGGIESGGRGDPYAARGAVTPSGDRAYGRYQVMGANIPEWTQAALGQRLTPRDFLASKEAQDTVFDRRFGEYANKYGDEGAARAWYAGERGMRNPNATDQHGRLTVAGYGQDYLNRLGGGGAGAAPGPAPVRVASLGGAGGTMSDAAPPEAASLAALSEPIVTPATLAPPAADENPPTPSDIKPMPVRTTRVAQAGPGIIPGSVAGVPGVPAAGVLGAPAGGPLEAAPGMPPSRAPIPPASVEVYPHEGPEPKRPDPLGPSKPQQYWKQFIDNPHVSPQMQAHAKREYDAEELYRRTLQDAQTNDYIDKREKWQQLKLLREKHEREAPTRDIKQLADRTALEKAQFEAKAAPIALKIQEATLAGKPTELAKAKQELENLHVEYQQKIRTLNEPKTLDTGGARLQAPYDPRTGSYGPYTLAPGSPKPKEEALTEPQAKGVQFVRRTMKDLDDVDFDMGYGKVLTDLGQHAIWNNPLLPESIKNGMVSDDYRKARDALGNWAAAFMSHVSGAAITPSEALRQLPSMIPQPNDTDADLKGKARRRRDMTEGVEAASGSAAHATIEKLRDELFAKEMEKPPVKVTTPEEARTMSSGRRIILPDGSEGVVPKRKIAR